MFDQESINQIIDDPNSKFRIHGIMYEKSSGTIKEGDMVLDRRSFTYGVVDSISTSNGELHASVRDGWVIEVGCPISKLQKLKISGVLSNAQNN